MATLIQWPKSYIFGVHLYPILNKSPDSRYGIIKRSIKEGSLLPIRRDLYYIPNLQKPLLNRFEIAPLIYGPSYVSFESALSYYQWIPEAVPTTTCATVKRSKDFDTPVGVFSFERIPIEAFPIGVEQIEEDRVTLFIANPWKAIADLIYTRKRSWPNLEALMEDLRIESESIEASDRNLLRYLSENYPSTRVRKSLKQLMG